MANVALWVKPKCCVWKDVVRSDLQTSVRDPRVDGMLVTNGQGMLPTVLGSRSRLMNQLPWLLGSQGAAIVGSKFNSLTLYSNKELYREVDRRYLP